MLYSEKLTAMTRSYTSTEALAARFDQPYAEWSTQEDISAIRNLIDDIQCPGDSVRLPLQEILARLRLLLKPPVQEDSYTTAKQIVAMLYEIIQKWYLIRIHDETTYNEVLLYNHFQTHHKKKALMIYILYPFLFPDAVPQHTNQVEAPIMAKVLSDKGYDVDIINTQYTKKLDLDRYDLILGFGPRFDEACYNRRKGSLAICYLTESSPYFSNPAELKRLRDLEKRHQYLPRPERLSTRLLDLAALMRADSAICLGNQQTVSTYKDMFHRIYPLNVTGFSDFPFPALHKTYPENAKNFLWYGGAGPIHKGLDLCIEAFRSLPDLHLSIVGELTDEFYGLYKADIENAENISYHGFLQKDSIAFRQISEQCGFCLVPSCSEGQSTAVITTMFSGLLPVCTKEIGIDVVEAGGFLIEDIRIDRLTALIRKLSMIDENDLFARQQKVYHYATEKHTTESYAQDLSTILDLCNGPLRA